MEQKKNIINVILDAGRGECKTPSIEKTTGEPYGSLPTPKRAGYRFVGWSIQSGKKGALVSGDDLVEAEDDIVLFAQYEKVKADDPASVKSKKKKSSYRTQKKVLFVLLGIISVLIAAYFVVNYIVSIIPFTDVDGSTYKVKKVDGVYSVFDADGYELETNEDGYYLTKVGTQLKLNQETGEIKIYAVVDVEGIEVAGAAQRILMFAQIKQSNVVSIEVHNHNGSFKIYNQDITAETKQIVIEGYESGEYLVSHDPELYAYLCVAAGYPLTVNKLPHDRVAELGLDEYGLVPETRTKTDEEGNEVTYEYKPIEYTITGALKNADGSWKKDAEGKVVTVTHTILIGDPVVGGGGYYCKLAGDENKSVYIMNNDNYEKALFQPIENLITPRITYPVSLNGSYNAENFLLATYDKMDPLHPSVDVAFDYIDLTLRSQTMYSSEPYRTGSGYRYKYGGYRLNSDLLSAVLQAMYEPSIVRICKLGVHLDESVLAEYGLDEPYKILSYDMQIDQDNDVKFDAFVTNELLVSKKTERGTYYVYSKLCDVIAEVAQHTMAFVENDTLAWINPNVIWHNLAYLKTMEISAPGYHANIVLDNSKSSQAENVNSTNLEFTLNGKKLDYVVKKVNYATGKTTNETPVYNLRQFYKTLLSLTIGGDARVGEHFKLTEEEMAAFRALDDSQCQLIIKIDVEDYAKITNTSYYPENNTKYYEFRFYRYSEGRSYMTINGEGEFFVDSSFVQKMLADAKRLEEGILIDSSAKN